MPDPLPVHDNALLLAEQSLFQLFKIDNNVDVIIYHCIIRCVSTVATVTAAMPNASSPDLNVSEYKDKKNCSCVRPTLSTLMFRLKLTMIVMGDIVGVS